MDGVVGLSQPAVPPGQSFTYEFDVTQSGTFFYHAHVGLQLDRGLYGALISEPGENDRLRIDRGRRPPRRLADHHTGSRTRGDPGPAGYGQRVPQPGIFEWNDPPAPTERASITRTPRRSVGSRTPLVTQDGQPVSPVEVSTLVIGWANGATSSCGDEPRHVALAGESVGSRCRRRWDAVSRDSSATSTAVVWPPELQPARLRYEDLDVWSLTAGPDSCRLPVGGRHGAADQLAINGQI